MSAPTQISSAGGDGGGKANGGAGGSITIKTTSGAINTTANLRAYGGVGSGGGDGGASLDATNGTPPGGDGSDGGDGGLGGTISVTSVTGSIDLGTLGVATANGGAGGAGGTGGKGGDATAGASTAGSGGAGGDGGQGALAGKVTITSAGQTNFDPTLITAIGGDGGAGGAGGDGGDAGLQGGNGGQGGKGGDGGHGGIIDVVNPAIIPFPQSVNGGAGGQGGASGQGGSPNGTTPPDGGDGQDGAPGSVVFLDDEAMPPSKKKKRTAIATANKQEHMKPVAFIQPMLHLENRTVAAKNVLVNPAANDVAINVGIARVHVSRNAAAFVVNNGHQITILSLHDRCTGDVSVLVGDQEINLRAGEAVLLTDEEFASAEQACAIPGLAVRSHTEQALGHGTRALVCEYSLPCAVQKLNTLRALERSHVDHERGLFSKILKNAAVIQMVGAHKGVYKAMR